MTQQKSSVAPLKQKHNVEKCRTSRLLSIKRVLLGRLCIRFHCSGAEMEVKERRIYHQKHRRCGNLETRSRTKTPLAQRWSTKQLQELLNLLNISRHATRLATCHIKKHTRRHTNAVTHLITNHQFETHHHASRPSAQECQRQRTNIARDDVSCSPLTLPVRSQNSHFSASYCTSLSYMPPGAGGGGGGPQSAPIRRLLVTFVSPLVKCTNDLSVQKV